MQNKCCVVLGNVNQVTDFDHNSVGYYETALHKSEKLSSLTLLINLWHPHRHSRAVCRIWELKHGWVWFFFI